MSISPPSLPEPASDIVTRLRAAGCVFAEDEARLLLSAARTPADLAAMLDRRIAGLPLEQVLGWAEFCGLRVAVDPGVFVPRRRTEFLVHEAVALLRPGAVVVDLCCGTGAGLDVLTRACRSSVTGVDFTPAQLDKARALNPHADVRFVEARIDDLPCLDHATPGPEASYRLVADHDGPIVVSLDDPGGNIRVTTQFDVLRPRRAHRTPPGEPGELQRVHSDRRRRLQFAEVLHHLRAPVDVDADAAGLRPDQIEMNARAIRRFGEFADDEAQRGRDLVE